MLKWVLIAALLLLLGSFVLWQRDTLKTSYVNGLAPYSDLPGRKYIFERAGYIFERKGHASDWPLVGDHEALPALPAEVTEKSIGADLPGVRILGVVRVGERFKIASVRRDEGRQGSAISFEILFLDEADRKYPRLDAFWIMDHAPEAKGGAPALKPEYAVPEARQ